MEKIKQIIKCEEGYEILEANEDYYALLKVICWALVEDDHPYNSFCVLPMVDKGGYIDVQKYNGFITYANIKAIKMKHKYQNQADRQSDNYFLLFNKKPTSICEDIGDINNE